MTSGRPGWIARALLLLVKLYRLTLSPLLPPSCRFEPSCSRYAEEALTTHGAARGTWLTFKRLLRCRPGGGSGYDPVPPLNHLEQHHAEQHHAGEPHPEELSSNASRTED